MIDEAKIKVQSGAGGAGLIAFRREKYVPHGGPAGGDGGHGGDVVLVVNPKISTLVNFQHHTQFRADSGGRGGSNNKTGASASPLELEVPRGTLVYDDATGGLMGDLVKPEDRLVIARGGRGGRGNTRFKSASRQAPRIAEKGEPGEERWLRLELKLIADVGLVGVPNAGKSTLLSVISNARPKIASYPFTTIEPNLGVVQYADRDVVVADIPGLIEGAHMGVGLGHTFLRHVQRTRVLVHLINGESADPLADYNQINVELSLFDDNLAEKPQLVVFNKMDLPQAQERWPKIERELKQRGITPLAISAATQQNVKQLTSDIMQLLETLPAVETLPVAEDVPRYELPEDDKIFEISRDDAGAYHVTGKRVERAAAMTYWDYDEAVQRFQNILETLGVSNALETAGVQVGDTVYIGEFELEWSE